MSDSQLNLNNGNFINNNNNSNNSNNQPTIPLPISVISGVSLAQSPTICLACGIDPATKPDKLCNCWGY